jgi:hypothetical protein
MSEQIGEFSLTHAGSTYAKTPEGELANYANFSGTATGFGAVFGTLKFQNPLSDMGAKSGECTWSGQAFLDDGTSLGGFGEGTWEQVGDQNKWSVTMNVQVSDGSTHRSEGEIDLATLAFTGKLYSAD